MKYIISILYFLLLKIFTYSIFQCRVVIVANGNFGDENGIFAQTANILDSNILTHRIPKNILTSTIQHHQRRGTSMATTKNWPATMDNQLATPNPILSIKLKPPENLSVRRSKKNTTIMPTITTTLKPNVTRIKGSSVKINLRNF